MQGDVSEGKTVIKHLYLLTESAMYIDCLL